MAGGHGGNVAGKRSWRGQKEESTQQGRGVPRPRDIQRYSQTLRTKGGRSEILLVGYGAGMSDLPRRKRLRLPMFDYARPGAYFVTVCTFRKNCLFGRVVDGRVMLSKAGRIAEEEWLRTAESRAYVRLDSYVIMPNHIHGVITIEEHIGLASHSGSRRWSLPSIVGGFKSATSRRVALLYKHKRGVVWQRSFYERVVRDDDELNSIRRYIADNPTRWDGVVRARPTHA